MLGTMCCCPEEGCLPDVCFVTVEFRGVEAPEFSTNPDLDSPPLLSDGFNPPAPGPGWTDDDLCPNCTDWNREWQLFLLGGVQFGDTGVTDFILAIGQARNDEMDGYQQEPDVYKILKAGDVCFPCADVGDNTGLRLRISCNGNRISADLTFVMDNCTFLNWSWDDYLPKFQANGIGTPHQADRLNDDFHQLFKGSFGDPCYTPTGVCFTDPALGDQTGEAFPCNVSGANDVDRFWDKKNCYWDNKLKPFLKFYKCSSIGADPNPTFCDPCNTEFIHHNSGSFSAKGIASETLIIPFDQPDAAGAVGDDVWRLCADGASNPGTVEKVDIDPCGGARAAETTTCYYDIFLRWGWNTSETSPGRVVIFSQDGPGPLIDFDEVLPFAPGSLDGPHNTHTINGTKYRRIGQIFAQCDSRITIEVEGPDTDTDCMDFDHLVLQRL